LDIKHLELKKGFFDGLDERQKRLYAAIEALSLGHGGQKIVSEVFGISTVTIRRGIKEQNTGQSILPGRVRKEGGGRKKNSD
jgi:hypothetical protein